MVKHVDIYYPIKVWILSIIGGPTIFSLVMYIENSYGSSESEPLTMYGFLFLIGFLYSIPSLVISYLFYRYALSLNFSFTTIKIALIILGFILFITTFSVMGYPLHKLENLEKWTLPFSYSITFLLGSIIFKIGNNTELII